MTIKTTINRAAINNTNINEEFDCKILSALLYQPEIKLIKIAPTIVTARGKPTANCQIVLFLRVRCFSQYFINPISSSVSIITQIKQTRGCYPCIGHSKYISCDSNKSKALKLAPLLAKYLYTHKRLDLPGIGTFLFDPSAIIESERSKYNKPRNMEGVSFESNVLAKETTELIGFISTQAGKMKALAAADLDSYIELAQQFLNIGKPFLFEGIGSLVKLQTGKLEFIAGDAHTEKIKEQTSRNQSVLSTAEESVSGYDSVLYHDRRKPLVKKPLYVLFLFAGIGVAVWGGYTVYKKTIDKNNAALSAETKEKTIAPVNDQELTENKAEPPQTLTSAAVITTNNQTPEQSSFKFVVEVAAKERALQRFGTLKGWGLGIQMETKDSASYNLFFILPASASDTTKIKDSLGLLYTPLGKKPFIEN